MSQAKLYTIPASHPGLTSALMLDFKGIEYKRVDLLPVVSKGLLRLNGFPGVTVPALKIAGEKVQGSRDIARALDRICPDPPLLPADGPQRDAVLEAERLGDEELQHPVRQILWWVLSRNGASMASFLEGSHTGVPIPIATKTSAPLVAGSVHFNKADDEHVEKALQVLPGLLDTIDGYVSNGTIGGETPNAADFQIAPSLCLAMTCADLRPFIEPRPCGKFARRVVPNFPGDLPETLPADWLEPMAEAPVNSK